MGHIHKTYYSANARYLSDEAIKDIKTSFGRVPDAINTMAKKYRISTSRVKEYIENRERKQQMIDSYPSQIQSAMSPEIISISLNEELENNHISLLQGNGSSSLHTSDNTRQKRGDRSPNLFEFLIQPLLLIPRLNKC